MVTPSTLLFTLTLPLTALLAWLMLQEPLPPRFGLTLALAGPAVSAPALLVAAGRAAGGLRGHQRGRRTDAPGQLPRLWRHHRAPGGQCGGVDDACQSPSAPERNHRPPHPSRCRTVPGGAPGRWRAPGVKQGGVCLAYAAPEWQTGSLRWHSREIMAACPLEGLVGRPSSLKKVAPLVHLWFAQYHAGF